MDPFRFGQFGRRTSSHSDTQKSKKFKPILLLKPKRWDSDGNRPRHSFAAILGEGFPLPQHWDPQLWRMVPCVDGIRECRHCSNSEPRDYAYVPAVHLTASMRLPSSPSLCYLEFPPTYANNFIFGFGMLRGRVFNFYRDPHLNDPKLDGQLVIDEIKHTILEKDLPESFDVRSYVKRLWVGTPYYQVEATPSSNGHSNGHHINLSDPPVSDPLTANPLTTKDVSRDEAKAAAERAAEAYLRDIRSAESNPNPPPPAKADEAAGGVA